MPTFCENILLLLFITDSISVPIRPCIVEIIEVLVYSVVVIIND